MFMGGFLSTFKFWHYLHFFFFNNRFLVSVKKIEKSGRTDIICPIFPDHHQPRHLFLLTASADISACALLIYACTSIRHFQDLFRNRRGPREHRMTDSEISFLLSYYRNLKILSVQLEIIILTKVSQKEKDKYYMISLTYRILNMRQMNISAERNRFTDIEKRHVVARDMGDERGKD